MKIQKIISAIKADRAKNFASRNEAMLNNYIRIHNKNTYGDSYEQMKQAREVIAHYAQREGISVDIYSESRLVADDPAAPSFIKDYASDKLNVVVQNSLTGESANKIVNANTKSTLPKMAKTTVILPIKGEDIEIARHGIRRTEDSFLRNLYRSIEELTRNVTGKNSK